MNVFLYIYIYWVVCWTWYIYNYVIVFTYTPQTFFHGYNEVWVRWFCFSEPMKSTSSVTLSVWVVVDLFDKRLLCMKCCVNNEKHVMFTYILRTLDREVMLEMQLQNTQPDIAKQTSHVCSMHHLKIYIYIYMFQMFYNCFLSWLVITRRQHIETYVYMCKGQASANSFAAKIGFSQISSRVGAFRTLLTQAFAGRLV